MFKKLIILTTVLELFTGCGNGGDSTPSPYEMMNAKQGIIIFYHYPEKTCQSNEFYTTMQQNNGFKDILIQLGNNSVRCADYNKDYPACVEADAEKESSLSCIVGFNQDKTNNPNNKVDKLVDNAIMMLYPY